MEQTLSRRKAEKEENLGKQEEYNAQFWDSSLFNTPRDATLDVSLENDEEGGEGEDDEGESVYMIDGVVMRMI